MGTRTKRQQLIEGDKGGWRHIPNVIYGPYLDPNSNKVLKQSKNCNQGNLNTDWPCNDIKELVLIFFSEILGRFIVLILIFFQIYNETM